MSTPGVRNTSDRTDSLARVTVGEIFPDGCSLDLVAESEIDRLQLLILFKGSQTVASRFERDGVCYIPPEVDSAVLKGMRFPMQTLEYGSTKDLFHALYDLFARYLDLEARSFRLLAHFVFSSWFTDAQPFAPSLTLVGPACSEAALLQRLLSCVCRRPLMLVDLSPASLCRLPMFLQPTLIIQEGRAGRALAKLQRASTRRSFNVQYGRIVDLFCAKVVYAREYVEAVSVPGLTISVGPSHSGKPLLDETSASKIAIEFQGKLLKYRLDNFARVKASTFDVPALSMLMRETAQVLGPCILEADVQADLVPVLQELDQEMRAEQTLDFESITIEAFLFRCHEIGRTSVLVQEVATVVNRILAARMARVELTPRKVGQNLKAVGLRTKKINNGGRGVVLSDDIRRTAHRLAVTYSVASKQYAEHCPQCQHALGAGLSST